VVATEAQDARRERAPHSTMRHPTKEAHVAEKRRSRPSFPVRLLQHENPICAWSRRLASAKPASNFESIFLPYLARLSSCAASLLYRRAPRRSHAEVSFVVTTSYEPRNHGARGSNLSSTRIFSSPRRPTCNPRNPQATRPPGMFPGGRRTRIDLRMSSPIHHQPRRRRTSERRFPYNCRSAYTARRSRSTPASLSSLAPPSLPSTCRHHNAAPAAAQGVGRTRRPALHRKARLSTAAHRKRLLSRAALN